MAEIMYRKAFQVILKDGVSIRPKPSLKAQIIGKFEHMDVAVCRDLKAVKENGQHGIWLKTLSGWSCLKLDALVTMIPLGQGKAWWEVTAKALSIRYSPGKEARTTKSVLEKGDCLVSRGLYPLPFENSIWLKLKGGFSCCKLGQEPLMRLKSGVEMWRVTNKAGLYIRAKPGTKKHILGFLKQGDLLLSRGIVMIAAQDNLGESTWIRHGRGWTCIRVGKDFLAEPAIPGSLSEIKQKPHRTYTGEQLHGKNAPAVVHVPPTVAQVDGKIMTAVAAAPAAEAASRQPMLKHSASEADLHGAHEQAPSRFDEIPEAEGVAVMVGQPQVINPAAAPAAVPAVVQTVEVVPVTSEVAPQTVVDVQVLGEIVG